MPKSASSRDVTDFSEIERRRIALTISGRDADGLPRVPRAGRFGTHKGHPVQYMHNGVRVLRGGYYGEWTAEIIRELRGVHEPQEEKAVAAVMDRLHRVGDKGRQPIVVELGSFWAYYSLWFLQEFPAGRAVCLEPDPHYMQVGVTNFMLNNREATFLAGAIGPHPGEIVEFVTETSEVPRPTTMYTLESLMAEAEIPHVDVLFVDIQGAEIPLLEQAQSVLRSGRIRFIVVSTHDIVATNDPMTHRTAERLILSAGGHVICEHSVSESFSGDGLIVASFDKRDADFTVEISHARAIDSLFGEWEPRLARMQEERNRAESELEAIKESKSWRLTAPLRALRRLAR